MPMSMNDSLRATPRGSFAAAYAFAQAKQAARLDEVSAYLQEVFRLAPQIGLDPAIVVAQSAEETGNWTADPWWSQRLNPAGIGVTGDPGQDAASKKWANGADSARAQLVHLFAYAVGPIPDGHALAPYRSLDPRYQAVLEARFAASAATINDLSGKWATDPTYGAQIASRGNEIFPDLTSGKNSPGSGHVPKPPVVPSWVLDKPIGWGRSPDAQRLGMIVGTCHHTMEGSLLGTDGWFHDPTVAALTDYGIGGSADGDLDGVIYEWVDPNSEVVPWANGTYEEATPAFGDGPAFVQSFGVDAINQRLRSIENSDGGDPSVPLTPRQFESLCFLTAWVHAEQAGQMPDTFNWNMHHREFGVLHQECPAARIWDHTNEIQARAKAIMGAYQGNVRLAPPLLVTYPPDWSGGDIPLPGA